MVEEQSNSTSNQQQEAVPQVTAETFATHVHDVEQTELEKANQSLVSTLRLGFMILSFIMILLTIAFLLSGLFMVEKGSVAVRVKFGELVKNEDGRVQLYNPGKIHWAWPRPIEDTVMLPSGVFVADLDESFWFHEKKEDKTKDIDDPTREPASNLDPRTAGSLITGDQQIAHLKLKITYRVNQEDPIKIEHFATNVVTDNRVTTEHRAKQFVMLAAEKAAVRVVASSKAKSVWEHDTFIKDSLSEMINLTQQELNRMETGLKVDAIQLSVSTPPLRTRGAYSRSRQAESRASVVISDERARSKRKLTEVAGDAYEALSFVIGIYKQAIRENDAELKSASEIAMSDLYLGVARADEVLAKLKPALEAHWQRQYQDATDAQMKRYKNKELSQYAALKKASRPVLVGGKVSGVISRARQYKNGYHQQMQREFEQFDSWYAQIGKDDAKRRAVMNKLLLEAREIVFANPETEVFRLPADEQKQLELVLQHDPDLARALQERKLKKTEKNEKDKRDEKFRKMYEE